ncbi:MAG: hypothetical protein ACREDJ_03350 [Methylocella sp.]
MIGTRSKAAAASRAVAKLKPLSLLGEAAGRADTGRVELWEKPLARGSGACGRDALALLRPAAHPN